MYLSALCTIARRENARANTINDLPSVLVRDERLMVDRRRASLTETGRTTPSALRLNREKRGVAATVIQFFSGSREVLGML